MATPQEICTAKCVIAGHKQSICGFGKVNPNNPPVVFTGCPACKTESAAGVTIEQAEDDMRLFMHRSLNNKSENVT